MKAVTAAVDRHCSSRDGAEGVSSSSMLSSDGVHVVVAVVVTAVVVAVWNRTVRDRASGNELAARALSRYGLLPDRRGCGIARLIWYYGLVDALFVTGLYVALDVCPFGR